jgi:hypothetical protein
LENERVVSSRACLGSGEVLELVRGRFDGPQAAAVHGHLDRCAGCRLLIAEAARSIHMDGETERSPRTLDDGERIGERYEVRRFIARGGMGEVYEAFDLELGEVVALKTLVVTTTDQVQATHRLLAEVRIARKVTHPNVCRILEFGKHRRAGGQSEIPFLTMPLLKGETLAARLARGKRLSTADCLRILRELAQGLEGVHAAGIIHRDFKSENVFLRRNDDGTETSLVMDFGLARALEMQAGRAAPSGALILGTPAYMAPEQVQGKPVTRAADVFAFGVVAFEMITGAWPFGGDSPSGIALARLTREANRPSSLVAGLDRRWDDLIGRCLKLEPERRFATMVDIAAALERFDTTVRTGRVSRPRLIFLSVALTTIAVVAFAAVKGGRTRAAVPAPGAVGAPTHSLAPPVASRAPALPIASRAPAATPIPPIAEPSPSVISKRAKVERRARVVGLPSRLDPEQRVEPPLPAELERQPAHPRNGDDLVDPF